VTLSGQIQQGYWKNGHLHGKGRIIFSDGSFHTGQYKDHLKHGRGE
jgi:hypothetical protein